MLKLRPFEVAERYGSYFQKTSVKGFVTLYIFLGGGGGGGGGGAGLKPAKLPVFHGSTLGNGVRHAGALRGHKYILFGQPSTISRAISIFYSRAGPFKPSF